MLTRLAPLLCLSLLACALPEEDFPDKYAESVCSRIQECDASDYENLYSSDEDCESDWSGGAETFMDAADFLGGVYNEDSAKTCISDIKDEECGDLTLGDYVCEIYDY